MSEKVTKKAEESAENTEFASTLTKEERAAIETMPYEEAREKLVQAVQALEAGGLTLDQSMRQWEIGGRWQSARRVCLPRFALSWTRHKRNNRRRRLRLARSLILRIKRAAVTRHSV